MAYTMTAAGETMVSFSDYVSAEELRALRAHLINMDDADHEVVTHVLERCAGLIGKSMDMAPSFTLVSDREIDTFIVDQVIPMDEDLSSEWEIMFDGLTLDEGMRIERELIDRVKTDRFAWVNLYGDLYWIATARNTN